MIHLWLITRKDFLFARGRLAVWYAVLAAKSLLALWLMFGGEAGGDPLAPLRPVGITLITLEAALAYLITAVVVQRDTPDGPNDFWRTRPIAGWRLLLAKVVSVSLLLVLPVPLFALPAWWAAGGSPSDLLDSALLQVLMQVLIVVPAAVMAVLTSGVVGFVFGSLTGYLIIPVLLGLATGELGAELPREPRLAYMLVAGVSGLGVLAAMAYLTPRRILRWTAGLVAATASFWLQTRPAESGSALSEGEAASFRSFATTRLQLEFNTLRPAGGRAAASGAASTAGLHPLLRVAGIPADAAIRVSADEQRLRWPDSSQTWRSKEWGPLALSLELQSIRVALGLRAVNVEPVALPLTLHLPAPGPVVARLRSEPATYSLHARLALLRPDVSLVQPVSASSWLSRRGRGFRILSLGGQTPGAVRMTALHSEILVRSRLFRGDSALADSTEGLSSPVLFRKTEGRLIDLTHREEGMLVLSGIRFATSYLWSPDAVDLSGRQTDLSLVWVTWQEVALVRRQLVAAGVTLELPR